MGTSRIEDEHRSIAAITAQPVQGTPVDIKPSETAAVAPPQPASYLDFEALIDGAGRRDSSAPIRSPQQFIADFVEPRISDPSMFQGGRSLSLLERLASDIIPALDESEELRSLASAIIADEIGRHRQLAARLHSGIAL